MKNVRRYNIISIRKDTGACTKMNATPMTHDQACTFKSKCTEHSFNYLLLEEVTMQHARDHVADWKRESAFAIRKEDEYASHVTDQKKEEYFRNALLVADEIRQGTHDGAFWCRQRMHEFLTGECVALLP